MIIVQYLARRLAFVIPLVLGIVFITFMLVRIGGQDAVGMLAGPMAGKAEVEMIRRNLNPQLAIRGVLLTMYDSRTNLAREVEQEVRTHFPATFRTVIPRSVRLAEAPSHGEPITAYDPSSTGARAYEELADELIERLRERELIPAVAPMRPRAAVATPPSEVTHGA